MVIKASSAAEIGALMGALDGDDDVRREAAIARLAVIGARAVDRLTSAYRASENRGTRTAILRVFEAIADRRALPIARAALHEGGDVAVAAAGVLRALLDAPPGVAGEALDGLVAAVLNRRADRRVRLAAFEALQDLPEAARAQVFADLGKVADDLRDGRRPSVGETATGEAVWEDAIDGRLPDDPVVLRDALKARGGSAPLGVLQKLVDSVRAKEASVRGGGARAAWEALRGAIHQTLALRGSRVALYDLRESVDRSEQRLPASFLGALQVLGDVSCLEPLAAAYDRVTRAKDRQARDEWWRAQLISTFGAIAKREKLTRRHAAMKRISTRWPDAADALLPPSSASLRKRPR